MLSLATHGSCFVKDSLRTLPDPPFDVLGDVAAVHIAPMEDAGGRPPGLPTASGMLPWFLHLRERGARRVLLTNLGSEIESAPEHVMSGFAGGVAWGVVVDAEDEAELVLARLGRIDRRAPDAAAAQPRHRTRLTLGWQPFARAVPGHVPLVSAERQLRAAIADMLDVSTMGHADQWTQILADARADADAERSRWSRGLVPGCYTERARTLVRLASAVWFFGGPGTFSDWGEVPADLRDRSEARAAALYTSCAAAVQTATNSVWFEE